MLFKPFFRKEEVFDEIGRCLDIGWTGIGYKTEEFEQLWCDYSKLNHCHFLNSASAGLHLALKIFKDKFNWRDDDEILTSPMTFVSTNHAILYESLTPVFSDIDASLCLDPIKLTESITDKTRAVIYVGIGGNAANLSEIEKICKKNNLILIIDAAHMAGTKWLASNLHVGSEADCVVFSYQAVKNCPSSDAGSICFKDSELDHKARTLSWLGIDTNTFERSKSKAYKWEYEVDEVGYKYHGNSIVAAIAIVSLRYLDEDNKRRRHISQEYISAFDSNESINPIIHDTKISSSRHLCQIIVNNRVDFIEHMSNFGISCGVHYKPNNKLSVYDKYSSKSLDFLNSIENKIVSLPLHLNLSDEDVSYITNSANKFTF